VVWKGYGRSLEDQESLLKCAEGEWELTIHGLLMQKNCGETGESHI